MALIEDESRRWHKVLTRFVAIIQCLAEQNITLRRTTETLYQLSHGNLLNELIDCISGKIMESGG